MAYPLTTDNIIKAVRHKLDERKISLDEEVIEYGESTDNESLDRIIKMLSAEAINTVHRLAPAPMLEPTQTITSAVPTVELLADDILNIKLEQPESEASRWANPFLRLVACRPKNTGRLITDVIPEDSPEGRMQLNEYVRGTWDDPRLILLQGCSAMEPEFILYGCGGKEESADSAQADISASDYLKEFSWVEQYISQPESETYQVSYQLLENYINQITGAVLSVYKNADQANHFFTLAKTF